MSACSEHWRSQAVELPVAERWPEEPGAEEHLKVKAAFSTAPPEHRGVVTSRERRAGALGRRSREYEQVITADLVSKCLQIPPQK